MSFYQLLVVEDDDPQFDLLETAIFERNKTSKCKYQYFRVSNVSDAEQALMERRFDAAIVDLRIPRDDQNKRGIKGTGEKIALHAIENYSMPVVVVSGFIAEAGEGFEKHKMLLKINKGKKGAFDEAVSWLTDQQAMMDSLAAAKSTIRKTSAEIFAKNIWPNWVSYIESESNSDKLNGMVTRQIVGHISELLGLDHDDNPDWHPLECYITPGLRDNKAHTGDIFNFEKETWIILTPQCDMATQKIDNVLLAKCEVDKIKSWEDRVKELKAATSKTKKQDPLRFITNYTNQNLPPSQHFLPPLNGAVPILVNFKILKTIALKDITAALESRVASLSAPFIPNLTQRFGSYLSRPGQPNIDPHHF